MHEDDAASEGKLLCNDLASTNNSLPKVCIRSGYNLGLGDAAEVGHCHCCSLQVHMINAMQALTYVGLCDLHETAAELALYKSPQGAREAG